MQIKDNMWVDRASHARRVTLTKLSLLFIKYFRLGRMRTWSLYRSSIFPRETIARSLNESWNCGYQLDRRRVSMCFLGMEFETDEKIQPYAQTLGRDNALKCHFLVFWKVLFLLIDPKCYREQNKEDDGSNAPKNCFTKEYKFKSLVGRLGWFNVV